MILIRANAIDDLLLRVADLVLKWTSAIVMPYVSWFLTWNLVLNKVHRRSRNRSMSDIDCFY